MLPEREEAHRLLEEAGKCNPGPWITHSLYTAQCAEKIAKRCLGMDSEKAYIVGLLHDIGRKFGVRHMGHIYDGCRYMMEQGYDEVARICLSHSFNLQTLKSYIGRHDILPEEKAELAGWLEAMEYDDYDLLIQLCDSLADAEGVTTIEERMLDVKRRYGAYPDEKWNKNMELKALFEEKMGEDIYKVVR